MTAHFTEPPVNLLDAVEAKRVDLFRQHLAAIQELPAYQRSPDDFTAESAAANIVAGYPAYYSEATYSDQILGGVTLRANLERSMFHPLADVTDRHGKRASFSVERDILDRLIPLNYAAVGELAAAYQIAGTFRTRDELVRRVPAPHWRPVSERNEAVARDAQLLAAAAL